MDVDVFDEFLGYRHCQRFFFGVRICIGVLRRQYDNLRRHYDNLDGRSYKLGRRHDQRPVRQLYKHE